MMSRAFPRVKVVAKVTTCAELSNKRLRNREIANCCSGLKIRVSVVRFRPWPPSKSSTFAPDFPNIINHLRRRGDQPARVYVWLACRLRPASIGGCGPVRTAHLHVRGDDGDGNAIDGSDSHGRKTRQAPRRGRPRAGAGGGAERRPAVGAARADAHVRWNARYPWFVTTSMSTGVSCSQNTIRLFEDVLRALGTSRPSAPRNAHASAISCERGYSRSRSR